MYLYNKSKLCVGNSSVVKIYIMRPKLGLVAKNATPRPSGWESNPLYHWATEAAADNLGDNFINIPLYFTGITISLIYIYWTRAQVVGNGFCSSVVEHWSSNPEDAGSIPSRKEFFATGPGLGLIMYILTTLEFPKHNHEFHLLTTQMPNIIINIFI